ncbi:META domain-containing protein [Leucobacter insecticola]|uniref:META domain-containing protein n=1 Tax=Leucobacter insecticola TaxID=2714934 RepID=A0A6G8FIL6_9MICO|nr:META domain-containing protein [Leucobacter insecticola]QIM16143.1 META domain-containing protein [Leucobacter insecticola]
MTSAFLRKAHVRVGVAAAVSALLILTSGCASGGTDASFEGVWGDPAAEGKPSLEFFADGSYAGTDGCNRVGGDYVKDEDGIADLGMMRTTMMFCEGVDTWLGLAQKAEISSGELLLRDSKGAEVGTLTRHED